MKLELEQVLEQVYRQFRRNQSVLDGQHRSVDIIATQRYADRFHKMLKDYTASHHGCPWVVNWKEMYAGVLGMTVRTYSSEMLFWCGCDVHVCITKDYKSIFAIPDYRANSYHDCLRGKSFSFPIPKKHEPVRNKRVPAIR